MKSSILVVEDDDSIRRSIVRLLLAHGFHTLEARDGDEALSLALKHLPSLVIMDLQLPRVSGNEAVRRMREQLPLAYTPVIALSATPDDAVSGLFDVVLAKPCSSETLITAIAEVVNMKSRSRTPRTFLDEQSSRKPGRTGL